jgi:hypothetical protein
MQHIEVRQLLSIKTQELSGFLPEKFHLAFEDGVVIQTTSHRSIYTSYFWDIFRAYPNTPILSKHHVEYVLKGKPLTSSTHVELLTNIYKDVIATYQLNTPIQTEHLLELVYRVTNNIQNEVTKMAESHVTSIDVLDFIEVVEHPIIKSVTESCEPTQISIQKTTDTIRNAIYNDVSLSNNALIKAVKCKMVNEGQVSQCVGVRGFTTEVDGSILKVPILTNYTRGMKSLYNFMAESRSAAKALYFSESPLQDAEYFARRLQLLSMTVERLVYVDCGTTKYLEWRVNPPTLDDKGKTVYPGDLKFMVGKYYLDELTGTLKEIKGNEEHLFNQVLKVRSVLYCQYPNGHEVCEMCFGALAKNVSRFANLGHLCAATMTQQTSQSVLSAKHLDPNSISANIVLSELNAKYLAVNAEKNAYLIRKELKNQGATLTISRDEAIGLTDILGMDDLTEINPTRLSSIECIEITVRSKNEEISIPIFVNQGNRKAVLTMEFLKYLKIHRWETDGKNNFVFDLKDWNFDQAVMVLPDMEYSFSDHSHQIAKVIESSMKNITDRSSPHSPVATLQELFLLVNAKLNVNIAALEVIIYAIMIPTKGSYGMARNHPSPVLGITNMVIYNRSLSNSYAYESQSAVITDPVSFYKLNRPSSVFDVFVDPKSVCDELKAHELKQH